MLICFECGFLESTITIPASSYSFYDIDSFEWDYEKQEQILNKPVKVRRYLKGFSKEGEQRLLEICRKLQMKYCKE